jgi:hypothetical protein
MPVTVKPITLWRKEVDNQPGILAQTLEPFATGGADLHVVMGYRYQGHETKLPLSCTPSPERSWSGQLKPRD